MFPRFDAKEQNQCPLKNNSDKGENTQIIFWLNDILKFKKYLLRVN